MDDEGDAPLPHYLARHIRLGFDSDDIAELINSIDSSQNPQQATLPHLPAEVLFHILEYVPVGYLFAWRCVCRGFRDAIDGGVVLYDLLKRTELIAYLGTKRYFPHVLSQDQYEDIYLLRAHFERIEDPPTSRGEGAKWAGTQAIFHFDDRWLAKHNEIDAQLDLSEPYLKRKWRKLVEKLQNTQAEGSHGTLRWCMRVDQGVQDLEHPGGFPEGALEVDLANKRVIIQWKPLLLRFLKLEMHLTTVQAEAHGSSFTFSFEEDCLRSVRRRCLRLGLDLNNTLHRQYNWELNLLRPLFGSPRYDQVSPEYSHLDRAEDNAIAVLCFLRREASMSERDIAHLKQLAENRSILEQEIRLMDGMFSDWKKSVFGITVTLNYRLSRLPKNPAAWSKDVRAREEERMRKWKSQRNTITQLTGIMKGSIEALSLPEDAFEDVDNDI